MRRASKDARDGAAAAGDVPEMRRAVVEALQSTLVLRKAKSAVSESLSATEGAKRTRGLKQGSNGRGGGDEPLATPNVEAIRALLEDLGWAKELRHAVYALVAAAKGGPDDGEPKRRGGRRETEPLASVVSARKQWEASINDELEAIARERHQPLVREREQRGDKADGALLPPTPSGAPLRFLFDSEDPRGNATSSIERLERGRNGRALPDGRAARRRQRLLLPLRGGPRQRRPRVQPRPLGPPQLGRAHAPGQQKGATFPTSKAPISAIFHSFRLIFGRAIISRNGLDAWMLFPERARAKHSRRSDVESLLCCPGTHAPLAAKHKEPTDGPMWKAGSAVPPCAVQPFRGFVSYTAPLTFVYEQEEPIYYCLRAMYAKFWCKLNVMRTAKCTLLPLCKLFEQLVIENHPKLFFYLVQIGVDPLAVALPWIQFGFVGLLDVDQVLLLWDRILGFEDLSLLPILAAAIFVYRSEKLLSATSLDDVKDMFSDGSILQVVPLIQTFLFCG